MVIKVKNEYNTSLSYHIKRILKYILIFLCVTILFVITIIGLFDEYFSSKIESPNINNLNYITLDGTEQIINFPNVTGTSINFQKIQHDNYLNIHLSDNDTYRIDFLKNGKGESIYINTTSAIGGVIGYKKILHLIPENITKRGYNSIIISPINGDGFYSFSHFEIQNIVGLNKTNYSDYDIFDFEIKKMELEIKPKDIKKIEEKRKAALKLGVLNAVDDDFVNVTLKGEGEKYKAKVRLKGDWTDHLGGDKWSLRIELKGDNCIWGLQKMSIQPKETRVGIWERLIYEYYREQGGVALRYDFVDVVINGEYKGVYALEEGMEKRVIENSLKREGPILKINEDLLWEERTYAPGGAGYFRYQQQPIEPFSIKKTIESSNLSKYADYAIDRFSKFMEGELSSSEVFDMDLYLKRFAILDIFISGHGMFLHNTRHYYNPVTAKLEPIPFDDLSFSPTSSSILFHEDINAFSFFDTIELKEQFLTELKRLNKDYPNFINRQRADIQMLEKIIKRDDNDFVFNYDALEARREQIDTWFIDQGVDISSSVTTNSNSILTITNNNALSIYINDILFNGESIYKEDFKPIEVLGTLSRALTTMEIKIPPILQDTNTKVSVEYRLLGQKNSVKKDAKILDYSFYFAGHAYGAPGAVDGLHKPLLEYFPTIAKSENIEFGIYGGNFVENSSEEEFLEFIETVNTTKKPFFVAPGNHDEANTELYLQYFDNKYYSFIHNNNLFLILDPDDYSWSISDDQINMIKEQISLNPDVNNIFFISHQLLWWEEDDPRFNYFVTNSLAGKNDKSNFWQNVYPILNSTGKSIYYFAGDVGAFDNGYSVLYEQFDKSTFVASGLGSYTRDNIIITNVYTDGTVDFELIALNGDNPQALGNLYDYRRSSLNE